MNCTEPSAITKFGPLACSPRDAPTLASLPSTPLLIAWDVPAELYKYPQAHTGPRSGTPGRHQVVLRDQVRSTTAQMVIVPTDATHGPLPSRPTASPAHISERQDRPLARPGGHIAHPETPCRLAGDGARGGHTDLGASNRRAKRVKPRHQTSCVAEPAYRRLNDLHSCITCRRATSILRPTSALGRPLGCSIASKSLRRPTCRS
jgi:hypothetical protein